MALNQTEQDPNKSLFCAVIDEGKYALVRVVGRGTFANSMGLKQFADLIQKPDQDYRFIIDLDKCETMDSTFMGVLAGIAITHQRHKQGKPIVVNANEQCQRLLKNLGLIHLLDLRTGEVEEVKRGEGELQPAELGEVDRLDQICLTLQAHKELVKLDEQNEVRFQAVIEYLEKSLEEEADGDCKC